MTQLEKIKSLVNDLPERDIEIAKKLIQNREIDRLVDLVNSIIYKVRKKRNSGFYGTENIEAILSNLIDLQELVIDYARQCGYDDFLTYDDL